MKKYRFQPGVGNMETEAVGNNFTVVYKIRYQSGDWCHLPGHSDTERLLSSSHRQSGTSDYCTHVPLSVVTKYVKTSDKLKSLGNTDNLSN